MGLKKESFAILPRVAGEYLSEKKIIQQRCEGNKGEPSWVKSYPFPHGPSQIAPLP